MSVQLKCGQKQRTSTYVNGLSLSVPSFNLSFPGFATDLNQGLLRAAPPGLRQRISWRCWCKVWRLYGRSSVVFYFLPLACWPGSNQYRVTADVQWTYWSRGGSFSHPDLHLFRFLGLTRSLFGFADCSFPHSWCVSLPKQWNRITGPLSHTAVSLPQSHHFYRSVTNDR
jgi:hypothetical protein